MDGQFERRSRKVAPRTELEESENKARWRVVVESAQILNGL